MRNLKNHKGQSLVEFALILPILLLLILGAMDIGRIITTKIVVTNAAREGANYISRNGLWSEVDDDIAATCSVVSGEGKTDSTTNISIDCSEIEIQPADCCKNEHKGLPVVVTVSKEVHLLFGNILQFLGYISGPLDISSSVKMSVQ